MGLDEFAPPCSWMITQVEDYSYFLTKAFAQISSVIKKYILNNIHESNVGIQQVTDMKHFLFKPHFRQKVQLRINFPYLDPHRTFTA